MINLASVYTNFCRRVERQLMLRLKCDQEGMVITITYSMRNVMASIENLVFPLAEATEILLRDLPGTSSRFGKFPDAYTRPIYAASTRKISREERRIKISEAVEKLEPELIKLGINVEIDDWVGLVKSLPKEHQHAAYAYFNWTRKSDYDLMMHLKREGVFMKSPYLVKEHECEACGSPFQLTFSKTAQFCNSKCPKCRHFVPKSISDICGCAICSVPDQLVLRNLDRLSGFIDNWIEANKFALMTTVDGNTGKVKDCILELWDIHYTSKKGSGASDLEYLFSRNNYASFENQKIIASSICVSYHNFSTNYIFRKIMRPANEVEGIESPSDSTKFRVTRESGNTGAKSKIFVLSGSPSSNGYKDFITVCQDKIKFESFFFESRSELGLYKCIADLGAKSGDIIVIVRGGGDVAHESFNAYRSERAADAIRAVVILGVSVIIGVGHSGDSFVLDKEASIVAITPTDAAYRLLNFIKAR